MPSGGRDSRLEHLVVLPMQGGGVPVLLGQASPSPVLSLPICHRLQGRFVMLESLWPVELFDEG